jgi:hypothetical protein
MRFWLFAQAQVRRTEVTSSVQFVQDFYSQAEEGNFQARCPEKMHAFSALDCFQISLINAGRQR